MRVSFAAVAALFLLTACAGQTAQHSARLATSDELSAIQATTAPVRGGMSGVTTDGLVVSGTITNTGTKPLRCRPTAFLLLDAGGNSYLPASEWCDVPAIAPRRSSGFSVTFRAPQSARLQLRFEHPDGTYEAHALNISG